MTAIGALAYAPTQSMPQEFAPPAGAGVTPAEAAGFNAAMAGAGAEATARPTEIQTVGRHVGGASDVGSPRSMVANGTLERWQGAIDGVTRAASGEVSTESRWTQVDDPAVRLAVEAAKDFRRQSVDFSVSMMKFGFVLEIPKKVTGKLEAFLKG